MKILSVKKMDINSLPIETFIYILLNTDGFTLGKCRRVCKKWKEILDADDIIWEKVCRNEFRYASWVAKKKCGNDCKWYHLYKNFVMWKKVTSFDINLREFYKFSTHDNCHALEIDYGVLPLKDTRGFLLYDTSTLKHIPVAVPEKDCLKISNNDYATVILIKSGLMLQRTTQNPDYMTEAFFKANNFVLYQETLYFYNNQDILFCDLTLPNLESKLIWHSEFSIKEIQYSCGTVSLFTDCGQIITINKDKSVTLKPIDCPPEWVKQIKHICAINDKNFICYSRTLFKIETDQYKRLYLDFPPITSIFFYGDFLLIGTKGGEVLLYRLSSQIYKAKPIFEVISELPEGKFAAQLDVCERKSGPVIVVSTFLEIIMIEIDFFPHEKELQVTYPINKLNMYKRLLTLRDRLRMGVPSNKAIA